MSLLQNALTEHALSGPEKIAKTAIATVWKVRQHSGAIAALKIYHGLDAKGEERGGDVLTAWEDGPAATVIAQTPGVVVLDWLNGPSLGDLSRNGHDVAATEALIKTAHRCHALGADPEGFETLTDRFAPLFKLNFSAKCPPLVKDAVTTCQHLGRELLESAPPPMLLHGDLHHDNVLRGSNGWTVIDPKGVSGDPAYEMANAFRNPLGNEPVMRDPIRTQKLALDWAAICGCSPKRVLGWAAAHSALSMAWSCGGELGDDPDSDLPSFYLAQRELV